MATTAHMAVAAAAVQRDRRAARTTHATLLAKLLQVAVRICAIPLSIHILGVERYGLWLAVSSLAAWMSILDAGVGAGVVRAIGMAVGAQRVEEAREYITATLAGAVIFSLLSMAAVVVFAESRELPRLLGLNRSQELMVDGRNAFLICGLAFACMLTCNSIGQIWLGLQQGHLGQIATAASQVLILAGLLVSAERAVPIGWFAALMTAPAVLAYLAMAIWFFCYRRPDLLPGRRFFAWPSLRKIAKASGLLAVVQGGEMVMVTCGNIVIANQLGPASVPAFGVSFSLLFFAQSLCYAFIAPLWPAYSEAAALGEFAYIRATFFRTLRWTFLLMLLPLAGFLVLGRGFIQLWAGPEAVPDHSTVIGLAAWNLLWLFSRNYSTLLIGVGALGVRMAGSVTSAAVFVIGSVSLLPSIGIVAVPLCGSVAVACELLIQGTFSTVYLAAGRERNVAGHA